VYYDKKKKKLKEKFSDLFNLVKDGKKNARCILVNADNVISKMVEHIPVTVYQNMTPEICPSNMIAKAAWILLRSQNLHTLDVSIWGTALEYHFERERIRAQKCVDLVAGDNSFGLISNRIYDAVNFSGYLCDLINEFVTACYDTKCINPENDGKIQDICRNIISDLIFKMINDELVLVAESTLEDICKVVVENMLISCSMFYIIKQIWRSLVRLIHPDHGGSTSDFQKCNEIFKLLGKFLIAEKNDEQLLERYRRSVVVVNEATKKYQKKSDANASARRDFYEATTSEATTSEGEYSRVSSSSSSQELVVFEEMCTTLVTSGSINESIAASLHTLYQVIPDQVYELMQLAIPGESHESGLSTTLSMMVIANGNSVELARYEQSDIVISHASLNAPFIFETEYPPLGTSVYQMNQMIQNLTSNELAIYQDYSTIRMAEQSSNVIRQMNIEEEKLDQVSTDRINADFNAKDANYRKNCKDYTKWIISFIISQIKNLIYFNKNVSSRDREEMLKLVLQTKEFPEALFISTMKNKYLNSSAKKMFLMYTQVKNLVGADAIENRRREKNLIKIQEGQEAKKLRDAKETDKHASEQVDYVSSCKSSIEKICQSNVVEDLEDHMKVAKAENCMNGLAWIRDLKCNASGEMIIIDMITGLESLIDPSLMIKIFSSSKEKGNNSKFTGKNKSHEVNAHCLLKKVTDRVLPEEYYLRPLILKYDDNMSIISIDAGTSHLVSKTIKKLRDRMEYLDKSNNTSKYEYDIDEIDASFELGKGEFIATFCAKRASKSIRSRENTERRQKALNEKTSIVITIQMQREFQYDTETGELVDDVVIETNHVLVEKVPTGSKNFYKLKVNDNFGKKSNGRVRF